MPHADTEVPRARRGEPASAVVIGLDCITGLQSARILAARGVPVLGVVSDRRHWGARTRSCRAVVESPLTGEELLVTLEGLARAWGGRAVLFPCTDPAVDWLSRHRDALPEGFLLPLAPHGTVELLMDKMSFAEHAAAAGLPAPRTAVLHDRVDVEAAVGTFTFPCVLKPTAKSATWLRQTSAKAFFVNDPDELRALYARTAAWAPALLLQEFVVGPESELYSCNAYFGERGEPLVTFVARKVRQWPPDLGTSASGEECRNDEVLATTLRVFGDVGFRGLAYLEMKRQARTGRMMIIEPNVGRPTGRAAIAEAGGVELLLTAYRDALGLPLPEARTQHYGRAKWLDLRRDAQAAWVARRRGALSLADWVRWLPGPKAHAIWSGADPGPFVSDIAQAARTGARLLGATRTRRAASPAAVTPVRGD